MQYSLTGQGNVRHIITGLLPGATYKIEEVSGEPWVLTQQAEQGQLWDYRGVEVNRSTGTRFFEAPRSGSQPYKLTRLGNVGAQMTTAPSTLLQVKP